MPIYEYQCNNCDRKFEKFFRSVTKIPAQISCAECQSTDVQRLMSAPTIQSGSGGNVSQMVDTASSAPPVFGRKELKQAEEKKRQLKEQVSYEKKQAAKKK
jgi:putative FmdB family regulatory protein